MNIEDRRRAFVELGKVLSSELENHSIDSFLEDVSYENAWFVPQFTRFAIETICKNFLEESKLEEWANRIIEPKYPKKIGLVLAGNIPLNGFHDILAVIISGHHALIKLSSRDKLMYTYILEKLVAIQPKLNNSFVFTDRLNGMDAVIATGSANTSRYFEYYFGKYPHILRTNRTSVAVLTGAESEEDLKKLAADCMTYFGLGCRNVSKIYMPENYDVTKVIDSFDAYNQVLGLSKFYNNYNYYKSIYLINREEHLDNGFLLFKKSDKLFSPISVIYYELFNDLKEIENKLNLQAQNIQIIVSNSIKSGVEFGFGQKPSLVDYADGINTIEFLSNL